MTTINSEQFGDLCNAVWRDRASVLRGSGSLSGEATLVRAVFWRLCKAGLKTRGCAENDSSKPTIVAYQLVVGRMLEANGRPAFDSALILKELTDRYANEVGSTPEESDARPKTDLIIALPKLTGLPGAG